MNRITKIFSNNLLWYELTKKEKKRCDQAAQIINGGEQSQLGTVFCFLSHMLKIFPYATLLLCWVKFLVPRTHDIKW